MLTLWVGWTSFQASPGECAAHWQPRCWLSKAKPEQLNRIADGDLCTEWCFACGEDFGLEAPKPVRVNRLVVHYASLHGRFLQPKPGHAPVQVWHDGKWEELAADLTIDYSLSGALAYYQRYGTVVWTYRFAPVETTRIRVLVKQCDTPLRWFMTLHFSGVCVQEVVATFEDEPQPAKTPTGKVVEVAKPAEAAPQPAEERLTDPVYRPSIRQTREGLEIRWPRPRLFSMVRVQVKDAGAAGKLHKWQVLWWDGEAFRPVERPTVSEDTAGQVEIRFHPVASDRLRVACPPGAVASVEVFLDREGQAFFEKAKNAPSDVLGNSVLSRGEPDRGRVAAVMLPVDFLKAFTGRPDDTQETLLTWNGTLISRTGEHDLYDRFVAFALNGRLVGADTEEVTRELIDGWMPGVIYHLHRDDLTARATIFTTAPTDKVYADWVHWEIKARTDAQQEAHLDVLPGMRLTMYGYYKKQKEGAANPCIYAPIRSGFWLDKDGQTVRAPDNTIVLWSSAPGRWTGTPLEPRLTISMPLRGREVAHVDLIVPHVGQRLYDPAHLASLSFRDSFRAFRNYWTAQTRTLPFVVPEEAVNNAARNALCQCLIIPDAGVPHYGTYWYEWCIGLEEWWPTIALAQFGKFEEAKKYAAAIIKHMSMADRSHHFPYRNGLAGMGAAEVALLTGDLDWYRSLLDNLKQRAEWTIRSFENDNRGTEYHGLIRKFAYGGDVHAPAHSLYSNVTCWRGLRDTGLMLRLLGENELAQHYLQAAEIFRHRIISIWESKINYKSKPPFVPLAFDIGYKDRRDPYAGEYRAVEQPYPNLDRDNLGRYWNLFTQMLLELRFYPPDRPEPAWLRDYCEKHGGVVLGLARYRNGVDWHYGVGYIKSLLWSGQREKFLLSFYSALTHGSARDTRTSPEVCSVWPVRASNEASRAEYEAARWNWQSGWREALGAPPGVLLQLLRTMLVDEGHGPNGDDGSIILLSGVPRRWLQDGKQILIRKAPTHYGPISMRLLSRVSQGYIEATLQIQPRRNIEKIVLKLFHPDGRPIRSAEVNGRPVKPADAETLVFSPENRREFTIFVKF